MHYSQTNLCPLPCTYISPSADSTHQVRSFLFVPFLNCLNFNSALLCRLHSLPPKVIKTWFSPLKSPTGHGLCLQALRGRHTASPRTFVNTASVPKRHRARLDLLLPQISHRCSQHLSHAQPVCPWDFCSHSGDRHHIVCAQFSFQSLCTFSVSAFNSNLIIMLLQRALLLAFVLTKVCFLSLHIPANIPGTVLCLTHAPPLHL